MVHLYGCLHSSLYAVLLLLAINAENLLITEANNEETYDKVVVCYISTWAVYRPGSGAYSLDHFDANLCTHVIYAFAGLDIAQSAIKSIDPWQDLKEDSGKGGYEKLTALKRHYPHLKVTLGLGGWKEGSTNYSILAADTQKRAKFVKQAVSFVRKYNFDGLDLDWEYPTQRGGQPQDRENFVQLVKELHNEFLPYNLILTSAFGATKNIIDQAYDIKELSKYLDYMHIMCYDYHGSWDKTIGFNAPLNGDENDMNTVQYSIDYLLSLGAPANKLVMGLPFYGRTYITHGNGVLGDLTDDITFQGPYTREDGFLGYNEICNLLSNKSSGWSVQWYDESSQALAYSERNMANGTVKVIAFDTPRSIANKVLFAVKRNLAGFMAWSIDTDDFHGNCDIHLAADTYVDYNFLIGPYMPEFRNYTLLRTTNEATKLAFIYMSDEIKISTTTNMPTTTDHDHNDADNEIPHGDINDYKSSSAILIVSNMLSTILFCFILLNVF